MEVKEINLPLVVTCLKYEAVIVLNLLQRSLFLIEMIKSLGLFKRGTSVALKINRNVP